ncbi:putative protein phosphatase 2C 39 [Wolffia australiana]
MQSKLNNMLMGILRVRNLISPPYVYTNPFTTYHRVTEDDLFVVLGSDGLFDLFSNEDVVGLVHQFVQDHPFGEPAKFLIEQLVSKVAELSGLTVEELLRITVGRRRKYHDDVTVEVIILGRSDWDQKRSNQNWTELRLLCPPIEPLRQWLLRLLPSSVLDSSSSPWQQCDKFH